ALPDAAGFRAAHLARPGADRGRLYASGPQGIAAAGLAARSLGRRRRGERHMSAPQPTSGNLPRADLPREGALQGEVHRFPVRVYYEDTDAAGIVYYANYLKFIERARTEMMRLYGVEHEKARQSGGTAFIVRRCEIEYIAPARLDDALVVETRLKEFGGASILLSQDVLRAGTRL